MLLRCLVWWVVVDPCAVSPLRQAESLELMHQHLVDAGGATLDFEPMDRHLAPLGRCGQGRLWVTAHDVPLEITDINRPSYCKLMFVHATSESLSSVLDVSGSAFGRNICAQTTAPLPSEWRKHHTQTEDGWLAKQA